MLLLFPSRYDRRKLSTCTADNHFGRFAFVGLLLRLIGGSVVVNVVVAAFFVVVVAFVLGFVATVLFAFCLKTV